MIRRRIRHASRNDLTPGAWVLRTSAANRTQFWFAAVSVTANLAAVVWNLVTVGRLLLHGDGAWPVGLVILAVSFTAAAYSLISYRLATVRRTDVAAWPWLQGRLDLLAETLAEQERVDADLPLLPEDRRRRHQNRDLATTLAVAAVRRVRLKRRPDDELVRLAEHAVDERRERLVDDPPDFLERSGLAQRP